MTIKGSCHCGNLSFEPSTDTPVEEVVARACDCSFCRIHGARNWSDPQGSAIVRVRDPAHLQKYVFALRTADFYVCRICGAYVGALLTEDSQSWSTLNLRLSDIDVAEAAASWGGEQSDQRITRRKQNWTPTTVVGAN